MIAFHPGAGVVQFITGDVSSHLNQFAQHYGTNSGTAVDIMPAGRMYIPCLSHFSIFYISYIMVNECIVGLQSYFLLCWHYGAC